MPQLWRRFEACSMDIECSPDSSANGVLRMASGSVTDHRPLTAFLYELMRDHLPPGVVEGLVRRNEDIGPDNPALFTNGFLANYAQHLTERLEGDTT